MPKTITKARGGPETGRPGEVRWPAGLAVVAAIVLVLTLPEQLLEGPRYVVPAVEAALLVPLVLANPYRMNQENRALRIVSLALAAVLIGTSFADFVVLLHVLVVGSDGKGGQLLLGALQVWLTNVIAFATTYWELDRGGPVVRHRSDRKDLPYADFRFSQDEDDDAAEEVARGSSTVSDWRPRYIDYLYVSVTNSTAFSPTDTMPLSPRAKSLMSLQSIQALLLSILVIARGVSLLK